MTVRRRLTVRHVLCIRPQGAPRRSAFAHPSTPSPHFTGERSRYSQAATLGARRATWILETDPDKAAGSVRRGRHHAAANLSLRELLLLYTGGTARVLAGETKPGQGETINAVIWFCDLRDSTLLSETVPLDDFLHLLNAFFDCSATAVLDHGGEIVSYIGDAVVAIFPIGVCDFPPHLPCIPGTAACTLALRATHDALSRLAILNNARRQQGESPLRFSIALHAGSVRYGSIGIVRRLQFTIVGPAVNEAARLVELCKVMDRTVVASSAFARCFPDELTSLGFHTFRGVSDAREVFGLRDDSPAGRT